MVKAGTRQTITKYEMNSTKLVFDWKPIIIDEEIDSQRELNYFKNLN